VSYDGFISGVRVDQISRGWAIEYEPLDGVSVTLRPEEGPETGLIWYAAAEVAGMALAKLRAERGSEGGR